MGDLCKVPLAPAYHTIDNITITNQNGRQSGGAIQQSNSDDDSHRLNMQKTKVEFEIKENPRTKCGHNQTIRFNRRTVSIMILIKTVDLV